MRLEDSKTVLVIMNKVRVLVLVASICFAANGTPTEDWTRTQVSSILNNPRSTCIPLKGRDIGPSSAYIVAKLLTTRDLKNTPITTLEILHTSIEDEGMRAIAGALPKTRITFLTLENNEIKEDGARAIAEILHITDISHLSLFKNMIGPTGATFIIRALVGSKITHLNLGGNSIGAGATQALADILRHTEITNLNLKSNGIGPAGMKSISTNLEKLSTLNLGDNKGGDDGAKAIASALKGSKLSSLDLRRNSITDVGAEAIASVLKNCQIIHLYLDGNEIGIPGLESLVEAVRDTLITDVSLDTEFLDIRKHFSSVMDGNEKKVAGIYYRFVKYVGRGEDRRLEFVVDRDSEAVEYIDFVDVLSKRKEIWISQFVARDRDKYGREPIEDFFRNLLVRLGEFLLKLDEELIGRVKWLLECDKRGFKYVVEELLYHRDDYALSPLENVLHPAVYILMEDYGVPWFIGGGRYTEDRDLLGIFETNSWDGVIKEEQLGEFGENFGKRRLLELIIGRKY